MSMTTPIEITYHIRQFGLSLVPAAVPLFVPFDPSLSGIVDNCFDNVAKLVKYYGGRSLLGWTIWEWPGVLLEATFHAVWEREDGELLDPTPKADGENTTLFVPDRNATDDGGVTLSRHYPLTDWPEVTQYIEVCKKIGQVQQSYQPKYGGVPDEVWEQVLSARSDIWDAIENRQERDHTQKALLNSLALSEREAEIRFLSSPADVEASIALARYLASRSDFGLAFETLLKTAELDRLRALEVRETLLQLFEACENHEMVNDFRRQLSMLLNP